MKKILYKISDILGFHTREKSLVHDYEYCEYDSQVFVSGHPDIGILDTDTSKTVSNHGCISDKTVGQKRLDLPAWKIEIE